AWKSYLEEGGFQKIKKAFQRCGQLNAVDGSENHLIRVEGIPDFEYKSDSEEEIENKDSDSEIYASDEESEEEQSD
ncbi:MAG: hypothetical protein MJK04_13045, partial [Psychrosphaera sp.]|nr:hypothetical protein [Psychrosphaera sp.]